MVQARQVVVERFGGPEVMRLQQVDLPSPGAGEVQLRQTAIGFNFIDVYQRKGLYPIPLPSGLGHESVGVVAAVGEGVDAFRVGDRVATMNGGLGAYATHRNVPAEKLVSVPGGLSDELVASVFFKGLTAQYLLKRTYPVKAGDMVLVHAAAGGVGRILAGWAKALGAYVVGTAGSPSKCELAVAAGCDVAIDYSEQGWVDTLLQATSGRKAQVVYDSVGRATFLHSLDCAEQFGTVVVYGAASGPAPAIDPELLNKKGCLFLTRPSVFPHNANPVWLRDNAADLFAAIASGMVQAQVGLRHDLADVGEAHRAVEARETAGSIVLIP